MANLSANRLRQESGAGLSDCHTALSLASEHPKEGMTQYERAMDLLMTKGLAVAHQHVKGVWCDICWILPKADKMSWEEVRDDR